jgi:hypothetical protein
MVWTESWCVVKWLVYMVPLNFHVSEDKEAHSTLRVIRNLFKINKVLRKVIPFVPKYQDPNSEIMGGSG